MEVWHNYKRSKTKHRVTRKRQNEGGKLKMQFFNFTVDNRNFMVSCDLHVTSPSPRVSQEHGVKESRSYRYRLQSFYYRFVYCLLLRLSRLTRFYTNLLSEC